MTMFVEGRDRILKRRSIRLSLFFTLAIVLSLLAPTAFASKLPPAAPKASKDNLGISDNRQNPIDKKQKALRQKALQARLQGLAPGKVYQAAKGKYIELDREVTDKVFVVIAEFGNTRHSAYPDTNPDGTPASDALTFDGPLHNSIPKPDRKLDNSTLWQPDYNKAHYENMYFNRMAKYWESQSSGRYSVEGQVTDWVKVPFNEARYGRDYCGDIICPNTWFLIRDAMSIWVRDRLAAGQTLAQITDYLKTFDQWDRYDFDGDGNFNEPDGYIDHFQIVHAGGDQAAGDPQQGSDAIWSHRWKASINPFGTSGPANLGQFGGVEAGQGGVSSGVTLPNNPTGVWVWDYTIQPENGGLGVFAHEYGHDLGLPDLYDTSGNVGGAENSTGFWTLYSSGSYGNDRGLDGIGDEPVNLGAFEKFQLGWLGCEACPGGKFYQVVKYGDPATKLKLGPAEGATKQPQALFVTLPDKRKETKVADPKTGAYLYYSSMGDEINTSMTKAYTLPAGASLTADVSYDIEEDYDYAFLEASTDNGATWQPVATNLSASADDDQSGFNTSGTGITGSSNGAYVSLTADLSAFTGPVLLRFRYQTDEATTGQGFVIDNIAVTGSPVDGAEDANAGWTFDGFVRSTGTEISYHFNAYIGENRGYRGYDESLRNAYNFGFASKPDWVEFFRYQDGLLISYWDTSYNDNNVGDHPGGGLVLPVDAHPQPLHWSDGTLMRPRIQSYDSTFGQDRTDSFILHKADVPTKIPSLPNVRTFDDRKTWWQASDGHSPESHGHYQVGWIGVNVPKTGTIIHVDNFIDHGFDINVDVHFAK